MMVMMMMLMMMVVIMMMMMNLRIIFVNTVQILFCCLISDEMVIGELGDEQ